jgi:hypothetical protein
MVKYMRKIIVAYTNDEPCMLIVDSYGAHISPEVREYAGRHNIELLVVPKCMTATLSPLDVGINGPLKSMYSKSWRRQRLFGHEANKAIPPWSSAVCHAISSYQRVTSSTIHSAFNNSLDLPPPPSSTLAMLTHDERIILTSIRDANPPPHHPSSEDIRGSDNYARQRGNSYQFQAPTRTSTRLTTLASDPTRSDAIIARTLSQVDTDL